VDRGMGAAVHEGLMSSRFSVPSTENRETKQLRSGKWTEGR
jgi:hypothetical protein